MTLNKDEFKTLVMLYNDNSEAEEKCKVMEEMMLRGMLKMLE